MKTTSQNSSSNQPQKHPKNQNDEPHWSDGMEDGEPPYDPRPTVAEELEMIRHILADLNMFGKTTHENYLLIDEVSKDRNHPAYNMAIECFVILCEDLY